MCARCTFLISSWLWPVVNYYCNTISNNQWTTIKQRIFLGEKQSKPSIRLCSKLQFPKQTENTHKVWIEEGKKLPNTGQSWKLTAFEHLFVYVNSYNFSKYNQNKSNMKTEINPQRQQKEASKLLKHSKANTERRKNAVKHTSTHKHAHPASIYRSAERQLVPLGRFYLNKRLTLQSVKTFNA